MPQPRTHSAALTLCVAAGLVVANGSVLNAGLPLIGRQLALEPWRLSWVVSAYFLPLGALLPLAGAMGDARGRRLLVCMGLLAAASGSVAVAVAHRAEALLLGRALQGAGAALVLPNAVALLGALQPARARSRSLAVYAAVCAAMAAGAPILGGWFLDHSAWRAMFMVGAALSVAAAAGSSANLADAPVAGRLAGDPAASPMAPPLAMSSAAPALLKRDFVLLTLFTTLIYGVLFAVLVLEPYALVETAGYSPFAAGSALVPLPLTAVAGSACLARLRATPPTRMVLRAASGCVAAGLLLLLALDPRGPYALHVAPGLILIGLGMALAGAPLTAAVLDAVSPSVGGAAAGLNSAAARLGGAASTALLAPVIAHHGPSALAAVHQALLAGMASAAIAALILTWSGAATTRRRASANMALAELATSNT